MFNKRKWSSIFWDSWCVFSIIGIWPRYIEPNILSVTRLNLPIPKLSQDLTGLKILQFSDLHFNCSLYLNFLEKLSKKINALNADIIVFTGDILTRSQLVNPEILKNFLCSLKCKLGCFSVLGNHDYETFVTLGKDGNYDIEDYDCSSDIIKGFKRLFTIKNVTGKSSESVKKINFHKDLMALYNQTPFRVLHNETIQLKVQNSFLNITGLGEHMLDKSDSKKAFEDYNPSFPGLLLTHNPDSIPYLEDSPGNILLAGHTHGGQVNLPWFNNRVTYAENPKYRRGLKKLGKRWIYINRGVGSVMKFRWFSTPEITLIILQNQEEK